MNLSALPEYAHHVPLPEFRTQISAHPLDLEACSVYFATDSLVEGDLDALSVLENGEAPAWATHVAIINRSKI